MDVQQPLTLSAGASKVNLVVVVVLVLGQKSPNYSRRKRPEMTTNFSALALSSEKTTTTKTRRDLPKKA
jgi:hypothetical protein